MAPKQITQRIALTGGDDFRAGLKSLGQAGQEAFKSIKSGIDSVGSSAVAMTPAFDAIQKRVKDVGNAATEFKGKWGAAREEVVAFGRSIIEVAALIAPIGAGELIKSVLDAGKAGSELQKLAVGLGTTTKEFQEQAYAAQQADVTQEEFAKGLGRLENKVSEAYKSQITLRVEQEKLSHEFTTGKINSKQYNDQLDQLNHSATEQTNVFNRLGIALTDGNGQMRNSLDITTRLREEWPRLTDAQKASYASQLGFSRDRSFLNLLNVTTEQWAKMVAEGRKLAPAMTQTEQVVSVKLNEAINKVTSAWNSMYLSARLAFAPAFTAIADNLAESIGHIRTNVIQYAQVLAGTLRPVLLDITRLLAGEEVDPHGFVGQFVDAFKGAARDVLQAFGIIKGAWESFIVLMDYIAALVNSIFGTEFTGRALAIVVVLGTISGAFGGIATIIGVVIAAIGVFAAAFGVEFAAIEATIAVVGAAIGYFFGRRLKDDINTVPDAFKNIAAAIADIWYQMIDGIKNIWSGNLDLLKDRFASFVDWVLSGWQKIKDGAREAFSIGNFFGSSTGNSPGFAGGGHVRGPGTSTSDSIRAWLSDGEFVVKAQAVQHYGAGFFDMLNNMKVPSPGFALGGLVDALSPIMPRTHFNTGGLVAAGVGGRPVIIQLGDSKFGPFTAGEDTVTSLERFAVGRQIRSAGRKPTWAGK